MFQISAESSYCLDSAIELSNKYYPPQIYSYLNAYNINVDNLIEMNTNFFDEIIQGFNLWFSNISKIEKDTIFYKNLLYFNYSITDNINNLAKNILSLSKNSNIFTKNKQLSFQKLNKLIKEQEINNQENDWISFQLNDEEQSLKLIKRYYYNLKSIIEYINKNKTKLSYSLHECIKYEEQKRRKECNQVIQNIDNFSLEEINGLGLSIKSLNKKDVSKKEQKSFKKIISKSVSTLQSFIGTKNVSSFIHGNDFNIEGKLFNYKISKSKYYNLLDKKTTLTSGIPYVLSLLDKENNYLCNMCVVFKECPIFDQILSVWMMIKSNEEIKLLDNSNIFKISENFYKNKNIIKTKHKFRQEKNNQSLIELTVDFNKVLNKTDTNYSFIKESIENKFIFKYLDKNMIDFIFKTEPTWDEMIDYESIKIFDDTRLNYLLNKS